ncbi:hypothetical protein QTP70_004696 [Hemibagrus guttatus]|uniref:Reverse transcriptase n=1 Tax=Hemibagrus guttatus TaxID=175788 RepID=A0AAE0USE7_9TELE|nr:hypothetical protein QTP70_004696 [Hemibagrus guttatus]
MVLDRKKVACTLQVGGEVLPRVEEFKYLGVLFTSEGRMDREIDRRIGAAAAVMRSMYRSVVVKKELSRKAKLLIYQSIYVPTLTDGHELWLMTKRLKWLRLWVIDLKIRVRAPTQPQAATVGSLIKAPNPPCSRGAASWLTQHSDPDTQGWDIRRKNFTVNESREQVEENLERWRFALERRGMKVSRSKTEYMCVNEREGSGTVRLQGEEVKKVQEFKYLGSTVQSNGECGKEVKKRVQAGWNGWRKVSGVLCDQKISARIKGKVYRTVVRLAMLYGLETVSLRKRQESELEVAELKMLRFSLGVTRLDRIRNEYIRGTAHVGRLGDKVREARLRWFGHVQRRDSTDVSKPALRQASLASYYYCFCCYYNYNCYCYYNYYIYSNYYFCYYRYCYYYNYYYNCYYNNYCCYYYCCHCDNYHYTYYNYNHYNYYYCCCYYYYYYNHYYCYYYCCYFYNYYYNYYCCYYYKYCYNYHYIYYNYYNYNYYYFYYHYNYYFC